jgi:hypothetical protein
MPVGIEPAQIGMVTVVGFDDLNLDVAPFELEVNGRCNG